MMQRMSQSNSHIVDLLPAYINGRLDAHSMERVRIHLEICATCRHELAAWEAVGGAAQLASAPLLEPSPMLMNAVWTKIDTEEKAAVQERSFKRTALHLCLVFTRQIPLIHKSIWIASVLVNIFMCTLVFLSHLSARHNLESVANVLAFFTTVAAGVGVAFIYQAEHDAGHEIILSTPTSIRIVMICRMMLVVGYNMALAAMSSAIIAIALGGTLWDFMHIWLGAMLLLASISLTIAVIFGSVVSVIVALLLEILQAIIASLERSTPLVRFLHANLLQTTPAALIVALLLIVFAVYYAPRQPRLSNA